jgi:hypothetical protein
MIICRLTVSRKSKVKAAMSIKVTEGPEGMEWARSQVLGCLRFLRLLLQLLQSLRKLRLGLQIRNR